MSKLFDDALGGKLSRRDVLRRGLALGLSIPALGALLAACGGGDEATATTAAQATNTTGSAAGASPTTAEATATEAEASPTAAEGSPTTEAAGSPTESAGASPTGGATSGRQGPGDPTMGQTIEPAGKTGGTLIEGSISDISTLMPIVSNDDASNDFQSLMFESLCETDPFTLSAVGQLAEQWETNADATEWTIYLRKNVTWHDGEPFVADDVKLTYDLHMNEATGSSYTSDLVDKIKSVDVVDDNTVKFTLNHTLVDFAVDVAVYGIIPSHIWKDTDPASIQTDGGATGEDPSRVVGTGPFKFKEWITNDHSTATRNDDYWNGKPNLDEYIYKVVPDQSAGVQQLKTGEIDFFQGVSPSQVTEFEGSDVTVTPADRLSFDFYGYNMDPTKTDLFQDVEVRQALMYALDRDALVQNIQFGFGQVAIGTMPPRSWAYNPDGIELKYPYDVDKAKSLLEQAGWVDTNGDGVVEKNGKDLAFTAYTNSGNQVREQYLTALQQYWQAIGVKMTPQLEPFPSLVDRITVSFDYEMVLIGFGWSASPDQSAMWATDSYGGGFNFFKYSNPQVDEVMKKANASLDRDERIDLYTQMQNLVLADLPAALICFPQLPTGVNNRVHNIFPSDINTYWNVETWWAE